MNPFERADVPRPKRKPRRIKGKLTRENLEPLAAAAASERDRIAILLMGWCGLRPGEVGGLRVADFDHTACEVTIGQQVIRGRGGPDIGELKSEASYRTVGVPASLCKELTAYVKTNPSPDGLLFHAVMGGLWADSKVNRAVKTAADRAGLTGIHAHLLRHLAGSMALDDGATLAEVRDMLGHATITETANTYVESLSGGRAKIAAASERAREAYRNGR